MRRRRNRGALDRSADLAEPTSLPRRSPAMASSEDPQLKLKQWKPTKKFFVGIDSDGCAFNSMEVKHNDCFSVALVREYGLAAISRQVHEAWDFVNLYSQSRGC